MRGITQNLHIMASIRKYGTGWRVFVRRRGISKTATFQSKREAQDWARRMEGLILSKGKENQKRVFRDFIHRYEDEVLDKKRNPDWERLFLRRLDKHPIADSFLTADDIIAYRDSRLKQVQGTTVNREMSTMSAVCTYAVREWKWLESNPFSSIRKPRPNRPRERRITQDEIDRLEAASGYDGTLETVLQRTFHAFLFALETAMRAGEIESLTWDNVDLEKRTAFLPMTKNGDSRKVPLSARAVELLGMLPRVGYSCFRVTWIPQSFYKISKRAGIKNLHFHDSRHEAITRLSRKLDVLTLARVVGHKRIQQLMTYYNESAEDIALRL